MLTLNEIKEYKEENKHEEKNDCKMRQIIEKTATDFWKIEGCVLMDETSKESHSRNTLCGFCRANEVPYRDSCCKLDR